MPRPNKPINPGRLDDRLAPARAYSWTKYSDPGSSDLEAPEAPVEVSVDDVTIVEEPDTPVSKYSSRGTAAHIDYDSEYEPTPVFEVEKRWTVVRSIEGRTYTRSDVAEYVEIKPEV